MPFEGKSISIKGVEGARERAAYMKVLGDKPKFNPLDSLNGKRESPP